jgi:hypothetical protein
MKKYFSTHNACTKYTQSANTTCDELIKNTGDQKT